MSSETSMVAADFRLLEWAAQIKDCRNHPAGMSVVSWCACHGITKANYYYRLRRVREACLETVRDEMPVQPCLLQHKEQKDVDLQPGLDISIKGFSIHVTESTSMPLLSEVLKVVQHAMRVGGYQVLMVRRLLIKGLL